MDRFREPVSNSEDGDIVLGRRSPSDEVESDVWPWVIKDRQGMK